MEQKKFEIKFPELQASIIKGRLSYGFNNKDEIWKNIGSNLCDKFFTEIA